MKPGTSLILNGEVILSGYVVNDADAAWMGESGYICPQEVREALSGFSGAAVVKINSDGGDPMAGEAIRSIVAAHPGGVTMIVEGVAASAASLILMGASRRQMTQGSLLMIHDPSTLCWGTEEELRKQAETTGKIADTYAAVYGAAAGMPAEQARQIMRAETWFSPEEAVAAGFAHEVVGAPAETTMTMMSAKLAFGAMRQGMAAMVARKKLTVEPQPAVSQTAAAGGIPAVSAITEEVTMTVKTPAADTAAQPVPPTTMVAPVDMSAAVAAERARAKEIRDMAKPFMASGALDMDFVDGLIDEGIAAAAAGQRILTQMAATRPATPLARVTRDETETKVEGIIEALMGKTDGAGREFGGIRLKSLAMHLAGPKRGFNEVEAIRAGMGSTKMTGGAFGVSDFSFITSSVMNRTLRAEYERRAANWQAVAGVPIAAADFRTVVITRFGGDFQLKKVLENGEYTNTTLQDEGDTLKIERRGRTINIGFETIINDDMGALTRIPTEFAIQARVMENSMVWALIRGNAATASDGVALFHSTHKNQAGTGAVISPTSVAAGRKAMWEQRALGVKDSDDFLNIEPDTLIVPPSLEIAALQFKTATTPASDGSVNPYKATLNTVVVPNLGALAGGSDTAWYLVSSNYPPVSVAYLDGYAAPTVTAVQTMNPDLQTYVARHIFGAANTEWRGAYRNPGA